MSCHKKLQFRIKVPKQRSYTDLFNVMDTLKTLIIVTLLQLMSRLVNSNAEGEAVTSQVELDADGNIHQINQHVFTRGRYECESSLS